MKGPGFVSALWPLKIGGWKIEGRRGCGVASRPHKDLMTIDTATANHRGAAPQGALSEARAPMPKRHGVPRGRVMAIQSPVGERGLGSLPATTEVYKTGGIWGGPGAVGFVSTPLPRIWLNPYLNGGPLRLGMARSE